MGAMSDMESERVNGVTVTYADDGSREADGHLEVLAARQQSHGIGCRAEGVRATLQVLRLVGQRPQLLVSLQQQL